MAKREDEQRLTCRLYLNEEKGRKTHAMIEELLSTGKFSNRNDLLVEGVQALYDKVTGQAQGIRQYMDEAKKLRILAEELGPILATEIETQITTHDTKMLAILARGNIQGNGILSQSVSNKRVEYTNAAIDREESGSQSVVGNGQVDVGEKEFEEEIIEGTLPDVGEEVGEDAANYMNQMFGQQI